jgi:hypothetical protein
LIVNPDSIAKGVILAVLQRRVNVPEELKLLLHCNDAVYFHCPVPADWEVVRIADVLETIWAHLQAQAKGSPANQVRVPLSLKPESVQTPPLLRQWGHW